MNRSRTAWYMKENPLMDYNYGNRDECPRVTEASNEREKNYRKYIKLIKECRKTGKRLTAERILENV